MQGEYLIFNGLILIGPLLMSFESRVRYVEHWTRVLAASLLTAIPFLVWDGLVTGRHWSFNEAYTLPLRILGLPVAELAFFLTTPFALVFIWEILGLKPTSPVKISPLFHPVLIVTLAIGSLSCILMGWEYTSLVLLAAAIVFLADRLLGIQILTNRRYFIFLPVLLLLILGFNSYLTGRPVVLYGEEYNLGVRIGTIPVEDFLYGISHITLVLIIYEWVGKKSKGDTTAGSFRNR